MKKAEYHESDEAKKSFEQLAMAVLRADSPKKQPKKATKRRRRSGKQQG